MVWASSIYMIENKKTHPVCLSRQAAHESGRTGEGDPSENRREDGGRH
jgi:hypothetical protein